MGYNNIPVITQNIQPLITAFLSRSLMPEEFSNTLEHKMAVKGIQKFALMLKTHLANDKPRSGITVINAEIKKIINIDLQLLVSDENIFFDIDCRIKTTRRNEQKEV